MFWCKSVVKCFDVSLFVKWFVDCCIFIVPIRLFSIRALIVHSDPLYVIVYHPIKLFLLLLDCSCHLLIMYWKKLLWHFFLVFVSWVSLTLNFNVNKYVCFKWYIWECNRCIQMHNFKWPWKHLFEGIYVIFVQQK